MVENELFMDGIDTSIEDSKIIWNDSFGAECSIAFSDIAHNGNSLAFFQYNEIEGKNLIRIFSDYDGNSYVKNFSYRTMNGHHGISFWCYSIKWHDEYLICIYQNDGYKSIVSIRNTDIKKIEAIDKFAVKEDTLYYSINNNFRKTLLPYLDEIIEISKDEFIKISDS